MLFNETNFKLNTSSTQISLTPLDTVNVLKYLPIEDKNSLIAITLQQSMEDGFYNPVKLQLYFELYTVYLYSDLEFTVEDKMDEPALYDILKSNNIIEAIINHIPEAEWAELNTLFYDYLNKKEACNKSIRGIIHEFVENLAPNAESALKILNDFKPEMFNNVMAFVEAANGNRPIQ